MENQNTTATAALKQRVNTLLESRKLEEACDLLARICEETPSDLEVWILRVKLASQLDRTEELVASCRHVIILQPDSHQAYYNLGVALLLQRQNNDAVVQFREVLRLQPDHILATFNLAKANQCRAQFDEALKYYRQSLKLDPTLAEAHSSMGSVYKIRGQIEKAIACYRTALNTKDGFFRAHSDLVFAMNFREDYTPEEIFNEHVRWGKAYHIKMTVPHRYANSPDPDRCLRVGYVSPDLRQHSVSYFFENILAYHNNQKFEIFCYSDTEMPDETSVRLQSMADHWRSTAKMSDEQFVMQVRKDRIDILVDLAGHTANGRLYALTSKPAPVQVTYLGYPCTTGVPAVDYRITDAWADPVDVTDRWCSERLVRLSGGFLCYKPPQEAPPVAPLAALQHGYVTFGSFNNMAKISPQVVKLWSEVLHSVPRSRLIIKNISVADVPTVNAYIEQFAAHGISEDRLDFRLPLHGVDQHLAAYADVDIGLDCFPYNGTTTTCEAMWMGAPVITLAGATHVGRVGVSLLSQTGQTDCVANSNDEYINIARSLAKDFTRLSERRKRLRQQIQKSRLVDGQKFIIEIQHAYRKMWSQWCKIG